MQEETVMVLKVDFLAMMRSGTFNQASYKRMNDFNGFMQIFMDS